MSSCNVNFQNWRFMMKYQWIQSNYKIIVWAEAFLFLHTCISVTFQIAFWGLFRVLNFLCNVFFQNPTLGKVNIHGSLILQTLLEFKNPKYVVNSLLHMTPKNLQCLACDPSGSHIMEVYFKSTTVTEKNKAAMVDRLQVITIVYSWDIIYTVHIMLDKL